MSRIGILGLGFLGKEIVRLRADSNLWVATSNAVLRQETESTIHPFQWEQKETWDALPDDHATLVLTIPPLFPEAKETEKHLRNWCQWMAENRPTLKKMIYISTTGVYPQKEGVWDEQSAIELDGQLSKLRILTERGLSEFFDTHILRSGAIYGPGRNILTRIQKGASIPLSEVPTHRIHVTDLAAIVLLVAEKSPWDHIINCCDLDPASTKSIVDWIIDHRLDFHLAPDQEIHFSDKPLRVGGHSSQNRFISNRILIENLMYTWIYPDWKTGLRSSSCQLG